MNRKTILAPMVVLLMLFAVAPVMACPIHSQKVTAWNTTTGLGNPPVAPKYSWTTTGGITIEIAYQSDVVGLLGVGSNTYNIYSHSVSNLVYKSKTGVADRLSDATWYVPALGSSNGFSGIVNIKYIGVTSLSPTGAPLGATSYSVNLALQGFGEFKGQTLILSYDGPSVKTAEWTGYCLIPK
jgi:hypothetical protein